MNAQLEASSAETLPATISAGGAQLPQRYEAACTAIAECERIDECKDWADKSAALASYAKQAKNDNLRVMAVRIQDRALRRGGELLKQIESQQGKRTDLELSGGAPTRLEAAADAGLSREQTYTALRVASIPSDDFERQVESDHPPTAAALAEQGIQRRPISAVKAPGEAIGENPSQHSDPPASIAPLWAPLVQFAQFCGQHEPMTLARSCDAEDARVLRRYLASINHWLERFEGKLAETVLT